MTHFKEGNWPKILHVIPCKNLLSPAHPRPGHDEPEQCCGHLLHMSPPGNLLALALAHVIWDLAYYGPQCPLMLLGQGATSCNAVSILSTTSPWTHVCCVFKACLMSFYYFSFSSMICMILLCQPRNFRAQSAWWVSWAHLPVSLPSNQSFHVYLHLMDCKTFSWH